MKILIFGINDAPEPVGIGPYTHGMACDLVERGHDIRVITAWPYYPDWRRRSDISGRFYRFETVGPGFNRIRCPLYIPRQPTAIRRIVHHLSFALAIIPVALMVLVRWRFDRVIVVAPSLATAPIGWAIARLGGASCLLHIQDFEIEAAVATGLFGRDVLLLRLLRRVESALFRRFDAVSTISPRMCRGVVARGVSASRVVEFRNWTDCEAIRSDEDASYYRYHWGIDAATIVLYSGTLARKQGLETVVEAARGLRHRRDIAIVICGDGIAREGLIKAAADLDRVYFFPLQPRHKLGELLAFADLHILPQAAAIADLVLPSKLASMLASGRPIIATVMPETGLADEIGAAGMITPPEDAAALAAAIIRLADDPDSRRRMGRAARKRAETVWDRAVILARFHQALMTLGRSDCR